MSEHEKENSKSNRRASFRIDDTLTLRIRILDDETLKNITADFNTHRLRYGLKLQMQSQNDFKKPSLVRIRKNDPDVADYLERLEAQITKLAERLDQTSNPSEDVIEIPGRVNLSSTGLRFRTRLPIVRGQMVEVAMSLSTQNCQVVMISEVVRVESRPRNMIAISLLHHHIHPEDTEAIIRHMARLQQIELQGRQRLG